MAERKSLLQCGAQLIEFDDVGSTNQEALRRAKGGHATPLWISANSQTAGRGRSGRSWVSQPGNLFASALMSFSSELRHLPAISLVAGVALHDAIDQICAKAGTAFPLLLKWPNDLLCYNQKLAGILVESSADTTSGRHSVVIGFGINLASAPDNVERGATALKEHGLEIAPRDALEFLASSLDHWTGVWQEGRNFSPIRNEWLERGVQTGSRLRINAAHGGPLEGRFAGLDDDGLLLLDLGHEIRKVSFGDVDIINKKDENER